MKTGLICATALALAGARANVGPIMVTPGPVAHVSFAGLDLNSREGRAILERRIRSAAETLCATDGDRTVDAALRRHACYKAAVASGLDQMAKISEERLAQRKETTAAGH
jgi:UrcA family protein